MESGASVEITGIEEACAALDRLPRQLAKRAYARALAAAAKPVVEALTARTPVAALPAGMFKEPGSLAAHIVTDIAVDANGNGGRASIGFGKYGAVARFVEYGHEMIGHKPGKKMVGTVEQHPFMRPATVDSADAAVEAAAESLKQSIDEGIPLQTVA